MEYLRRRFKADNLNYVNPIFKKEDPKDVFIAMNEMMYHLEKTRNIISVCYWIEWILNFELQDKKAKYVGARREYSVSDKYKQDVIWLIWDGLRQFVNKMSVTHIKIFNALLTLFSFKYTTSIKRKRVYLIYSVVYLIIENVDLTIKIINDKSMIMMLIKNGEKIFKQLKKNEVLKTGKLYTGEYNDGFLESSLKKMEILNNLK